MKKEIKYILDRIENEEIKIIKDFIKRKFENIDTFEINFSLEWNKGFLEGLYFSKKINCEELVLLLNYNIEMYIHFNKFCYGGKKR